MNYSQFVSDMQESLNEIQKIQITPSSLQTKDWRKMQEWYKNGKQNECEKYQCLLVQQITGKACLKTNERINMLNHKLLKCPCPMKHADGFEWTENFDGKQEFNNYNIYYNLKMVCDSGGAQTRTLREVYWFIKSQLYHLLKFESLNLYFVNILDGNECHRTKSKFEFILSQDKFANVKKFIFVGDMCEFYEWFNILHLDKSTNDQ